MQDIVDKLGSEDFARLRVGIGPAAHADAVGHVLGRFSDDEQVIVGEAVARAAEAVECWVDEGAEAAMTRFNRRIDKGDEGRDE